MHRPRCARRRSRRSAAGPHAGRRERAAGGLVKGSPGRISRGCHVMAIVATAGYADGMISTSTKDAAWTARQDLVVEIASPEVAAEKLGRTVEAVLARRQELGLPDPLSRRERLERQRTNLAAGRPVA